MNIAVIFQLIFAVWFFIIHFVSLPPLNDLDKYPNKSSWNLFLLLNWALLIGLIFGNYHSNFYCHVGLLSYLSLIMFGHVNTWWLPYFFGWPKVFIDTVEIDHKKTFRFLPQRANRPVPDLAYCILGLTGLLALILTILS